MRPGTCRVRRRPMREARIGRSPSTSATSCAGRRSPRASRRMPSRQVSGRRDGDFDDGDFDTYNERNRAPWTTMSRDDILARFESSRPALIAQVRRLSDADIRGDGPWSWVYFSLHGHYLDHLGIIETWDDTLQVRQIDGDPFIPDPRAEDHAAFVAQDAAVEADLDRLIRPIAGRSLGRRGADTGLDASRPCRPPGRLGRGGRARHRRLPATRSLAVGPGRGHRRLERAAWSLVRAGARRRTRSPGTTPRTRRSWWRSRTLSVEDLRSPDGWSWTYDCLHGHTRKHLAMLGPWCVAQSWATDAVRA